MQDYCRCCAKTEPQVILRSEALTDPASGGTCRVPICRECEDKARRGDRDTGQKLKPFMPGPAD